MIQNIMNSYGIEVPSDNQLINWGHRRTIPCTVNRFEFVKTAKEKEAAKRVRDKRKMVGSIGSPLNPNEPKLNLTINLLNQKKDKNFYTTYTFKVGRSEIRDCLRTFEKEIITKVRYNNQPYTT